MTWRVIPGYSRYEASELGEIRSLITGRVMALTMNPRTGYWQVGLYGDISSRQYSRPVHWWVTLAFFGVREPGQVVRHLDGCRTNNALANLKYGSASENVADTFLHGYVAPKPFLIRGGCRNGHPITAKNTRIKGGVHFCRACDREQTAARRHARRMEIAGKQAAA